MTDEEISVHSVWHSDQSCCINASSFLTKWGKKFIRNVQVEAPQTPISFFHPKGKTHFKVLPIILSDSSFTLKLNEVQWNTTNRTEIQINAENTVQFFSKGWAEKQRGGGEYWRLRLKRTGGSLTRNKLKWILKFSKTYEGTEGRGKAREPAAGRQSWSQAIPRTNFGWESAALATSSKPVSWESTSIHRPKLQVASWQKPQLCSAPSSDAGTAGRSADSTYAHLGLLSAATGAPLLQKTPVFKRFPWVPLPCPAEQRPQRLQAHIRLSWCMPTQWHSYPFSLPSTTTPEATRKHA